MSIIKKSIGSYCLSFQSNNIGWKKYGVITYNNVNKTFISVKETRKYSIYKMIKIEYVSETSVGSELNSSDSDIN